MKRKTVLLVLFLIIFITTYMILCFAIPGMRIKLEAEPMNYFLASISHMVLFKAAISFVIAIVLVIIPLLVKRK